MNTKTLLLLVIFLFSISIIHAQEAGFMTNDEGRTWFFSYEPTIAEKSTNLEEFNSEQIQANYIKIFDFVDPQFPNYPFPVVFGDANKNGKIEMYRGIYVSSNNAFTRVYEFDTELNYSITDLPFYGIPWALGDIDGNGLADLVIQSGDPGSGGSGYLRVYESTSPNSFPTVLKSLLHNSV